MHTRLNATVKNRESFRPFAPAALAEHAGEHFQFKLGERFPYMLFAVPATSAFQFPAIANVDHSARLQTVDAKSNPLFHRLLTSFHRVTNCPLLVNTSFNVRGEPIVCTPADAFRCYAHTDIDALVIGRHLLQKESNQDPPDAGPDRAASGRRPNWLNVEVPWNPTLRMLRQFAFSFVITLPAMALILGFGWAYAALALVLAIFVGLATAIFPKFGRFIYRTLLVGALPVVLLLSEGILATIFYCVLTPIGLLLRLLNFSSLPRNPDPKAKTYWERLVSPRDSSQYYRQW